MTTANNAILFNAALNGYLAGALAGAPLTDSTQADYAGIVSSAVAWATEIDSIIPTDDGASPQPAGTQPISVVTTGVAIAPTTGTILEGQLAKTSLMTQLSYGVAFQRYATGLTATTFASLAAAVKAAYLQAAASFTTP